VNCEQGRNLRTCSFFLACACLVKNSKWYVYAILTFFNEPTLSVSMMETFCVLGGILLLPWKLSIFLRIGQDYHDLKLLHWEYSINHVEAEDLCYEQLLHIYNKR